MRRNADRQFGKLVAALCLLTACVAASEAALGIQPDDGMSPLRTKHSSKDEPYEVVLGGAWEKGREGYDPALPGYHLRQSPIARIELRSKRMVPPEKLVLTINAYGGFCHFSMSNEDTKLTLLGEFTHIHDPKDNDKAVEKVETRKYFKIDYLDGDYVRVTLMPAAMQLLAKRCVIRCGVGR